MYEKEKLKQLRDESIRQLRRFSEPLKRQIVLDIEAKVTTIGRGE